MTGAFRGGVSYGLKVALWWMAMTVVVVLSGLVIAGVIP